MFIGEFSHSVDQKGRLAIPYRFRKNLTGGAVVTRGVDDCLFLYPKIEWEKLAQKLASLPIADTKARAFSRLMLAGAAEVGFDRQGRILLPNYLRKYASLKNSAVVAGLYNRVEIWDEKQWNLYKDNAEKKTTDIAEHLANLGI